MISIYVEYKDKTNDQAKKKKKRLLDFKKRMVVTSKEIRGEEKWGKEVDCMWWKLTQTLVIGVIWCIHLIRREAVLLTHIQHYKSMLPQ